MRRVGFFFLFCHLSQQQNTVSLFVCPLGRYGLYVESIFSHCLAVSSVFLALVVTVCSYKKLAIFTTNVDAENETFGYHKTVCGALNRQFLVGAVMHWAYWFSICSFKNCFSNSSNPFFLSLSLLQGIPIYIPQGNNSF